MSKRLLEAFNEDFVRELKYARNHPEAYDRAAERWERERGIEVPCKGYDSFRMKKQRERKRRKSP